MRLPEHWRKQLLRWLTQVQRSLSWLLEVRGLQIPAQAAGRTARMYQWQSLTSISCKADLTVPKTVLCSHYSTPRVCHSPQELSPWFRWLVYQALLTLLLRALAKRIRTLQPYLEALALL